MVAAPWVGVLFTRVVAGFILSRCELFYFLGFLYVAAGVAWRWVGEPCGLGYWGCLGVCCWFVAGLSDNTRL
jgi:hypothetical protein